MLEIYDLVEAVRATLAQSPEVLRATGNESLLEEINDDRVLEVYPEEGVADAKTQTDRTTFGMGVQQEGVSLHIDYYARQRSHMGEDMAQLTRGLDSIRRMLKEQQKKPFFGVEAIQTFRWTWRRVTFEYGQGENATKYAGVRFTLEFRL